METFHNLKKVLEKFNMKKISVVGTMCTGKSTYLKMLGYGRELRDVSPSLNDEQYGYLYNSEWTESVGEKLLEWRANKAQVLPSEPVFGTAIVPGSDLVVYLRIDDELLKQRVSRRSEDYNGSLRMKKWIEKCISKTDIPCIIIDVKD